MAAHLDADIVFVGTHNRMGIKRVALGSVAETIAHHARCPVLIVRPKEHGVQPESTIEPPCPDCVRAQEESHGARLWCARHGTRHPRAHVHYEVPESFGVGSMLVRP